MRFPVIAAILACSVLFSHAQEKRPGLYLKGNVDRISAEEWIRHTADASNSSLLYVLPGPRHSVSVLCGEQGVFLPFDEFLPRCRDILALDDFFLSPGDDATWWVDESTEAVRLMKPVDAEQLATAPQDLRVWFSLDEPAMSPGLAHYAVEREFAGVRARPGKRIVALTGRAESVREAAAMLHQSEQFNLQRRAFVLPAGVDAKELAGFTASMGQARGARFAAIALDGLLYARGTSADLDLLEQILNALAR